MTDDRAERSNGSAVVSIPRLEVARVADALDAERRTIERNAGIGPRTKTLSEYVANCQNALSNLSESDEHTLINRPVAAGAAGALQVAANTETGDYAEEIRELADVLRRALDRQPQNGRDVD